MNRVQVTARFVGKHLDYRRLAALLAASAATSVCHAQLINSDFEAGTLIGWNHAGNTTVLDSSAAGSPLGVDPISPTHEALLSTVFNNTPGLGVVLASTLETDLGLPAGSLTGLGGLQGSAIWQTFHADAGQTLTFSWDFASQEQQSPTVSRNDFAFVALTPAPPATGTSTLADVATASFSPLPTGSQALASFGKATGWQTFNYTFTTTGDYQLGLGVMDGGTSHFLNSGLYVDSVALSAVPEPKMWTILAGLSLCGVAVARRLRISRNFAA